MELATAGQGDSSLTFAKHKDPVFTANFRKNAASKQAADRHLSCYIPQIISSWLLFMVVALTAPTIAAGQRAVVANQDLRYFQPELLYHPLQILNKGEAAIQLSGQVENAWMYRQGRYRIDTEISEFEWRGSYGLGSGLELAVEVPIRYYSGGVMDPVIEGFHSVFGFSNDHRGDYPQDDFAFETLHHDRSGDTAFPMQKKTGWSLVRPAAAISYIWTDSPGWISFSSTLMIRFPGSSGEEILVHAADDLGLSIGIGVRLGAWNVTAQPSISWQHESEVAQIALHNWQYGGSVSLDHHVRGSNHRVMIRLRAQRGIASDFSQLAKFRFQLMSGYNRRISPTTSLEIGLSENVFYHDNSPDFGLHLAFIKTIAP